MYGYRQGTNENGLMTNLNSISSSLSSIDTAVTRRSNYTSNNKKSSNDNLITSRNHSIASTSLLWKGGGGPKEERYSTAASIRNGARCHPGSEIYYNGNAPNKLTSFCFNSQAASNFILVPLLLLTIIRQVIDFLGQIWLQILINFFTIIIIIIALFGIRQQRLSYLTLFTFWALLSTVWNIIVICIHTKIRDVGMNEDVLSFHTGATSWWHTNGPGCLPYNITSFQNSLSMLQPNIITGCRLDYHYIESSQAALHAFISFTAALVCSCLITNISKSPMNKLKNQPKTEKQYRLNNLMPDRARVNQDPFPNHSNSRLGTSQTASLRRSGNKASSRSSQHSISSMRSARRRNRQPVDSALPTPRGSSSSMQRSQKYGSLSSRRSAYQRERRSDVSSLTYGTNSERPPIAGTSNQRTRLSSMSSADYLPSYQPPHSSNANLLSSYGEISSTDSYNNRVGQRATKHRQSLVRPSTKGNTNPTYTGSRSSVCSYNTNANNYDDLSYIYGNNNPKTSEAPYGSSTNGVNVSERQKQQIYQQNKSNSLSKRNGFANSRDHQANRSQKIQAETYVQLNSNENLKHTNGYETMTKSKYGVTNGSFQSFTAANSMNNNQSTNGGPQNSEECLPKEINNNHPSLNYQEPFDPKKDQPSINGFSNNGASSSDNRSRATDGSMNMESVISNHPNNHIYTNQRYPRYPIYSNHISNGNSETPI